ncbi:MAG: hypothetical protein H6581_28670 [Bacteroidia bacterium]|nr:hypothetical protein [Bacteroidia bacterium]
MKRRTFLKKAGLAAAGAAVFPYILPSGRLFASSGAQLAEHVVFVLFAGGVRQQESVLQRYLDDSQGVPIAGNIMYNMLEGAPPTQKIVYGTNGSLDGNTPIPKIINTTLEKQGTLFKEVHVDTSGHYAGLNGLVSGNYAATQGLKQKPVYPTIFEYARRHMGLSATQTWFVGNTIGNSVPLLNYSTYPDYGAAFGANFIAPQVTFGAGGQKHMANAKVYHPEEELGPMYRMKYFLDSLALSSGKDVPGIKNTDEEKNDLKNFFKEMYNKTASNSIALPPVRDNADLTTIGYACEVLKWFKPTLTVVNLSAVDGCHGNFTGYLKSLHRADHGVAHLWNYIQTQIPEMAGKTAMVIIPEHGRNDVPNPIIDQNLWYAYDHSDDNSKRIFGMMVGPNIPANLQLGDEANPLGHGCDGVLTIAEILGFKNEVLNAGLTHGDAMSMFDRI